MSHISLITQTTQVIHPALEVFATESMPLTSETNKSINHPMSVTKEIVLKRSSQKKNLHLYSFFE